MNGLIAACARWGHRFVVAICASISPIPSAVDRGGEWVFYVRVSFSVCFVQDFKNFFELEDVEVVLEVKNMLVSRDVMLLMRPQKICALSKLNSPVPCVGLVGWHHFHNSNARL